MGVRRIFYSGGGEPLCHPRIFDILRLTAGKGIETTLITNFTVADEKTVGRIIDAKVSRLVVSLWAGDESTYAAMHPGTPRGTFGRVVSLLRGLHAPLPPGEGPQLIIMNVISNRNAPTIDAIVRCAAELGAAQIWFQPVDVETPSLKSLLLSGGDIDSLSAALNECARKYAPLLKRGQEGLLDFGDFQEKLSNSRADEGIFHSDVIDTMPCYMGWYECRILANGDVVPCCKADKFPLGSIHARRFRDIWFSPRYEEFRRRALTLPKSDPYFKKIWCAKVCDDWWLNKQIHKAYEKHRGQCGTRPQAVGRNRLDRICRTVASLFRRGGG
jgi:MoaA/NifB/PqqE/SkfB family radical SAM enzyme